jgi:hypothetical protein
MLVLVAVSITVLRITRLDEWNLGIHRLSRAARDKSARCLLCGSWPPPSAPSRPRPYAGGVAEQDGLLRRGFINVTAFDGEAPSRLYGYRRRQTAVFTARAYRVCLRLRDRRLCGDQVGGGRSRVGTSPCPIR